MTYLGLGIWRGEESSYGFHGEGLCGMGRLRGVNSGSQPLRFAKRLSRDGEA